MMSEDYQINELAKKAGVSVRTIRFYIDEGLLPAPSTRGRYTVYTDEYLERIELIRLLKNRFLPLKEIRSRLAALDPHEVRAALREEREQARRMGASSLPQSPDKPGALNYIDHLLNHEQEHKVIRDESRSLLFAPETITSRRSAAQEEIEDTWTRVRLAPGIELHIQQPVEESARSQLRLLLNTARKIFNV
jgi:DNA-binding transcriptional MerR regulator